MINRFFVGVFCFVLGVGLFITIGCSAFARLKIALPHIVISMGEMKIKF